MSKGTETFELELSKTFSGVGVQHVITQIYSKMNINEIAFHEYTVILLWFHATAIKDK